MNKLAPIRSWREIEYGVAGLRETATYRGGLLKVEMLSQCVLDLPSKALVVQDSDCVP